MLKRTPSRLAGLSLRYVAGVATHDPTDNFKIYSRRLLDHTHIESTAGFELALELTVKAHLTGLRIAEIPTKWQDTRPFCRLEPLSALGSGSGSPLPQVVLTGDAASLPASYSK